MKTTIAAAALLAVAGSALANSYNGPGGTLVDFVTPNPGVFTSSIVVSDSFLIADGSALLSALTHTWIGDVRVTLGKSGGPTVDLVNRIGQTSPTSFGDSSNFNGNYEFANVGGNIWTAATAGGTDFVIPSGAYQTSTSLGGGAATNAFAAFAGLNAQGTWTLTITDFAGGDTGALGSWTLNLTPVPSSGALAVFGVAGLAAARRRRA